MRKIFFLHIHKTGGTSLSRALEVKFSEDTILPVNFAYELENFPITSPLEEQIEKLDYGRYQFIRGHIGLNIHKQLFGDARVITMLREPAARLISSFHFWQGQARKDIPDEKKHKVARKISNFSLEDFVFSNDIDIIRSTHNIQARVLAGGRFGSIAEERTQIIGPEIDGSSIVKRAKKTIKNDLFAGITEQMQDTLVLLEKLFDLNDIEHLQLRENSEEKSELIDPLVQNRIIEINKLDYQVYEYARELFERKKKTLTP